MIGGLTILITSCFIRSLPSFTLRSLTLPSLTFNNMRVPGECVPFNSSPTCIEIALDNAILVGPRPPTKARALKLIYSANRNKDKGSQPGAGRRRRREELAELGK